MRIFGTIEQARDHLAGTKVGERVLEAVATSLDVPSGITFSVGDSLTWRSVDARCAEESLVAHRRYARVVACHAGSIRIETLVGGTPAGKYSDLSDRQLIRGPGGDDAAAGSACELSAGQIAFFAIDEATRLCPSADFSGVLLRVTVEGRTFRNK